MSYEVDWVLDTLASVVSAQPSDHPLWRVDRDDSEIYETDATVAMASPIHDREGELQQANIVGVTEAGRSSSPMGSAYDHRLETTVGVRIEGLHTSHYGHVDPAGSAGVIWHDGSSGLVDQIRDEILKDRTYPGAGPSDTTYTDLLLVTDENQSAAWTDHYRHDLEFRFRGKRTLP